MVPDVVVLDWVHPGPQLFDSYEPDTARYLRGLLKNYRQAAQFGDYRILFRDDSTALARPQVSTN